MRQPVGPIIDGLDITTPLCDEEFVTGAVVLLIVSCPDNTTALRVAHSPMSWLERVGALRVAETTERDDAETEED